MKKGLVLLLLLLIEVGCGTDEVKFFEGRWYGVGDDIILDFAGDKFVFKSKRGAELVKGKEAGRILNVREYIIYWVGAGLGLGKKYKEGERIIFRDAVTSEGDGSIVIEVPNIGLEGRYYFNRGEFGGRLVKYYELLRGYEKGLYLGGGEGRGVGVKNLTNAYNLEIVLNGDGKGGFGKNNLIDGNLSSYYEHSGFMGTLGLELEFVFSRRRGKGREGEDGEDGKDGREGEKGKDGKEGEKGKDGKDGKELSHNLRLSGIGIVSYPDVRLGRLGEGSVVLNNIKDREKYHRLKEVRVWFSQVGLISLGGGFSSFQRDVIDMELEDKSGLQVIYFLKDIYTNGVKLRIKEIYPGYLNNLRIYEIIFFIKDFN